jgi:Ca2+-binding EF-hand superfamily protein
MKKSNINQKHFYEVFSVDSYLSTGISKGEILELKDAFDLLDSNSTGSIDPMGTVCCHIELRNIFKAFGIDQKNLSLEIALSDATSSPKPIDFASFLQIFTAYFYAPKSRASYKKVFKLFDDENMGCITAKNLRRVMKELNL